jgi:hypothetical protein
MECAGLANTIDDFGGVEAHDRYTARLKAEYGRRTSFWSLIS